jgi:hypothetical protein
MRFVAIGLDSLTTDRIKGFIDDLQQIRDAMHPADASPAGD